MSTVTEDSLLLTAGEVQIEATAAPAIPRVNIVAYTGGLMTVPGWGPVAIDLAGVDAAAEQIQADLYGPEIIASVFIEPRPYMGPALEKTLPKLPSLWANSVT